ncbi:hypothetical protein BGZ75_000561, partial [Mortierella antarctica]
MYVQLTIELITKAIELFCKKDVKKKDAKKVYASLVEDDEVDKHYFCGAICTKSKNVCMKQVDGEGKHCNVHDPSRKCQGFTVKGEKCGSVAKMGETHCWRHRGQEEYTEKRTTKGATPRKFQKFTEEEKRRFVLHPDYVDPEEITHDSASDDETSSDEDTPDPKGKTVKKKSSGLHTPEYVVDSEESADEHESSEDEIPYKKHSKKKKQ